MSLLRSFPILSVARLRPAFFFLALAVLVAAGCVLPSQGAPARALPYGSGLLWQVERDGVAPSYVYGTIHVADERVLTLPQPVRDAFDRAQSATFEIILDERARMVMTQASILTDGRTVDQIIGAELFRKAALAAADYGMPGEALKVFKPWALVPIFSLPPDQLMLIAAGKAPLDEWLQTQAGQGGKKVYALETIEEQLALFEDMSEPDQTAMLASLLDNVEQTRGMFRAMIESYLARDLAAIYQQMVDQASQENPELAESFQEDFIVARNKRMVTRMAGILGEGGSFVAVGALHLPGDEGVLNLLAEQGYRVTRVY